jgi:ParB family chromosome partitioning protein
MLAEGKIQAGHARALLGLVDDEARSALALRAAAEDLSVRQVEELVRTYSQEDGQLRAPKERPVMEAWVAEVEEILSEQLQTRVRIQMGKRRGKIIVEFGSGDDLERIVQEIVRSGGRVP